VVSYKMHFSEHLVSSHRKRARLDAFVHFVLSRDRKLHVHHRHPGPKRNVRCYLGLVIWASSLKRKCAMFDFDVIVIKGAAAAAAHVLQTESESEANLQSPVTKGPIT
jgi:hypothetical protein